MDIDKKYASNLAKETLYNLKSALESESWKIHSQKGELKVYHMPQSTPLMIKGELHLENIDAFEFARALLSFKCRKDCRKQNDFQGTVYLMEGKR